MFHIILGVLVFVVWFYCLANLEEMFPYLAKYLGYGAGRRSPGTAAVFFITMPLVSSILFVFGNKFSKLYSPRTSGLNDPIFTPGFYYICGYLSLFISVPFWFFYK